MRKKAPKQIIDKRNTKSLRKAVVAFKARTYADIKKIRILWAQGYDDQEIRAQLKLSPRDWRRRIRVMRAIPPDEDVVSLGRRYVHQTNKTIARLNERMKALQKVHDKAAQEIEVFDPRRGLDKKTGRPLGVFKRPRNLELAATTAKDLALLDREILKTEQELIFTKQRLGLIEPPEPDAGSMFDFADLITAPNLMKAWQARAQLAAERKKASMNGEQKQIEEAVIVPRSDQRSTE